MSDDPSSLDDTPKAVPEWAQKLRARRAAKPRTLGYTPNPKGGPKEHLARANRFTDDEIAQAIRISHGVFADAAKYLTRKTGRRATRDMVSKRIAKTESLSRLVRRIRENCLDYVEKRMWGRIEADDPRMIAYYLNTFGQERGYGKKDPVGVSGEIKIEISADDAKL
jgi:hypothetical protein